MKKFFTTILVLISFSSFTQTKVGLKLGGNYFISNGDFKTDYGKGKPGFQIGIFTSENKGPVNILFEAIYLNTTIKKAGASFALNSISTPIALETNTTGNLSFHVGVSPIYNIGTHNTKVREYDAGIRPVVIDLIGGFEIILTDNFGIQARASYPMLNYSQNNDINYKPLSFFLSIKHTLRTFDK